MKRLSPECLSGTLLGCRCRQEASEAAEQGELLLLPLGKHSTSTTVM